MDESQNLDILMNHMGDFGKYQAWQFTLHVLSAITAGLNMLSLSTVAAIPEHRCRIDANDSTYYQHNNSILQNYIPLKENSEDFDSCHLFNATTSNETFKCDSWIFDTTYFHSSRAIEWNFVCDRRWMGAVAQSTYMLGVFTGAVSLGNLADKFGRKPIFCWSALLQLLLGVGVAFSPNYLIFLLMRYFYGIFGSAGSFIPGFVLTMELVGPSKRSICGISFQAAFAVGIMLVAAWGSVIKDRFLLQILYGSHAVILLGHFWLMDESPRWLWANGRQKEAIGIIKKALKMNKVPIPALPEAPTKPKEAEAANSESAGLLDLFKTPRLRKITLNICLAWFANSLVYYGLSLNTGSLRGNPYLILFIMGLVEMPSFILTVYIMDRTGRRSITAFSMIFGAICCIISANLAIGSPISTWCIFIGKFLIASSFGVIYNYSAELFPTIIRNSAMGLGSMCARTSAALTPLIILFDSFDPKLPAMIFAVISLISGFLVLFLPETLNQAMPQSLQDGEQFGIGDTFFRKKKDVIVKNRNLDESLEPLKK